MLHPDGHAQSLATRLVSVGSRVRSTKSSESCVASFRSTTMAERDPPEVEGTASQKEGPGSKEKYRDAVREVLLEIPGFRALAERGIAEGVMSDPPSSAGTDRAMVGGSETLATAVAPGGSGSSSAEERPPGKTA